MAREFACKDCGHIGIPLGSRSGGGFLAGLMFLLFMLPIGLFGKKGRCRKCGSSSLASLTSKYGKAAMEEFYMDQLTSDIKKKSSDII
ncbi:MAG: hypothetical protein KGQ36_01990 [Rickettsiales bacterium]|nr:hypothetical protein [Rickettsiales bacterium]